MRVEELNMSAATELALMRAGIETVEELKAMTSGELAAVRGIGMRSLNEIVLALAAHEGKDSGGWYTIPGDWPPLKTPVRVKLRSGETLIAKWVYAKWTLPNGKRLMSGDVVGWRPITTEESED